MKWYHYYLFRQDDHINSLRQQEFDGEVSSATRRAIELRNRKREICNIIHNTTWLAESGTLLLVIVFQLATVSVDPYIVNSVSDTVSALVFWRIVAPYTHLFNEQRIKVIILESGWVHAMISALQWNVVRQTHTNSRVVPIFKPEPQSRTVSLTPSFNNSLQIPVESHRSRTKRNENQLENQVKIFSIDKKLDNTEDRRISDAHTAFVTNLPKHDTDDSKVSHTLSTFVANLPNMVIDEWLEFFGVKINLN